MSMSLRWGAPFLGLLFGLSASLFEGRAEAYPYQSLRPADQVIGGPTDGYLSAFHYNPAGLRLFSGSQLMVVAGARGYIGGYQRSQPLPAGFAPDQTASQQPDSTQIGWVTSDMMVAGSWDLRSESVTVGFALYTPHNDETHYADRDAITGQTPALQSLSTRYQSIADRTYSLWGTVAFGLKLRPWLYVGAGFQFGYTHSRMTLMRDLDPTAGDGLSCAGLGPCQQWSNRQLLDLDVQGWGYGFTSGILVEPVDDKLWIGLSYVSPLFTSAGAEVGLDGQPQRLPWDPVNPSEPCGPGGGGVRVSQGSSPTDCGAAHMARSFPHTIYLGVRGHVDMNRFSGSDSDLPSDSGMPAAESRPEARRLAPTGIELTSWARLVVPPRHSLQVSLDERVYAPGLLTIPTQERIAVALAFGVRELWPRLVLAQELLYESPRTDPASVSPANLDGHKLDFSLAARIKLQKRLWLLATVGLTGVIFSSPGSGDPGTNFSSDYAGACRASGYDVTTFDCQRVQDGYGIPSAAGSYWLIVPHGVAGLEVNL